MSVVLYHPYDGADGLQVLEGNLRAWAEGDIVGETKLPESEDLPSLLARYRVPALLPDLRFAFEGQEITIDLSLEAEIFVDKSLTGIATWQGSRQEYRESWMVDRIQSKRFLENDVPEGQRPWAEGDTPGWGWRVVPPPTMSFYGDPVLEKRTALAIESFVYSLAEGREMAMPYRRRFTNIFSASEPMWRDDVPFIARGS